MYNANIHKQIKCLHVYTPKVSKCTFIIYLLRSNIKSGGVIRHYTQYT